MSDLTYTYLLADARHALEARRLYSALSSLRGLAALLRDTAHADELDTLISSYAIMLDYMERGASDPERSKLYRNFTRRAWEISDALARRGQLSDDTAFYTTSRATLTTLLGHEPQLADLLRPDAPVRNVFDALWTSGPWTADDEATVAVYLGASEVCDDFKLVALSAVTLSAMSFFDIAKVRTLIALIASPDLAQRVRALVGLTFVLMLHPDRLMAYPDELASLTFLTGGDPHFAADIETLQTQLFLSLETKRIERDLQEKLIPKVMKRIEHLRLDRSLGLDDLKDKLASADLNPEWEADGSSSELEKYMSEFVELQQRGADMYMSSFKMFKQRFPFFRAACNWFYPFTLSHPDVPEAARHSDTLRLMLHGPGLCDSDKFSFAFMAAQLPGTENFTMPGSDGTMGMNSDDVNEVIEGVKQEQQIDTREGRVRELMRSYVQGFYRFTQLYYHRESFADPFKANPFLADLPPYAHLLSDKRFVERMAEVAFKDKAYALALSLFRRISADDLSAGQWQKMGYSAEQAGDLDLALTAYGMANDIKPSSPWTLRHLAGVLRQTGSYESALVTYQSLAEILPDDASVAMRQAECLIHLKRYDEAFKFLFKADYLSEGPSPALRALGWCSLLTGKTEQAEKYYRRVIDEQQPGPTDWLNAGHVAWLSGHVGDAIARYRKALPKDHPEDFLKEDADLLRSHGLDDEAIALMTDAVLAKEGRRG